MSTARAYASFTPTWQRFTINGGGAGGNKSSISPRSVTGPGAPGAGEDANPYLRQYSHVYSRRLAALRDRCLSAAEAAEAPPASSDATNAAAGTASSSSGGSSGSSAKLHIVSRILELQEDVPSTIVGTVAKETPARPAVDTGYHSSAITSSSYLGTIDPRDLHLEPLGTYCSPADLSKGDDKSKGGRGDGVDRLFLEDESGRIELVDDGSGVLNMHELATGVVVSVTGSVKEGTGTLVVKGVHLPTLPVKGDSMDEDNDEEEIHMSGPGGNVDADPYLLLISGLGCGASNVSSDGEDVGSLDLRRDMVLDYLAGHSDPKHDGARVARVVVAGGGCATPAVMAEIANATKFGAKAAEAATSGGTKKGSAGTPKNDPSLPIKELDLFLSELCASGIPVDYVPGLHDPTTAVWPQRPLHPCLLPQSSTFEGMLHRSPNPYEAKVGDRVVLGTDGRNVADLRRYIAKEVSSTDIGAGDSAMEVDGEDEKKSADEEAEAPKVEVVPPTSLETLESTLNFSHLAPTGPDSLPTYPAFEDDPFVMEDRPDLYFAGNCSEFDSKITKEGTRLVCIPSFDKTGQAVLVNLKSLDCEVISFADA